MIRFIKRILGMGTDDEDRLFGAARSSRWPKVREEHLKRQPACRVCGRKDNLEVHHVLPVHLRPDLELVEENLLTLCEAPINHHLEFGHLGAWKSYNALVELDAHAWFFKRRNRP